jgi:hypothetical protein
MMGKKMAVKKTALRLFRSDITQLSAKKLFTALKS